jgi:hypothetical protein
MATSNLEIDSKMQSLLVASRKMKFLLGQGLEGTGT